MMGKPKFLRWFFSPLPKPEIPKIYMGGTFETLAWVRAAEIERNRRHWLISRHAKYGNEEAILMGTIHFRWCMPIFESMPMGGYGGWHGTGNLSTVQFNWLSKSPFPVVVLTDYPTEDTKISSPHPKWPTWSYRHTLLETHILDLTPTNAELLANVKSNIRSYMRKVDQLGFSFHTGGSDLLSSFMTLYREGKVNWSKKSMSNYSESYFHALCEDGGAEIWLASKDGECLCAIFFLVNNQNAFYLASGVKRSPGSVSPMDALMWTAILDYKRRGFTNLNMGASRGLDSVRKFKEKFGGQLYTYSRNVYFFPAFMALLCRILAWLRS
jgi:hypothetical protein